MKNLFILRKMKRVSQMKLAKHLNCSQSYISMIETGAINSVPVKTKKDIADFLGVTVDDLERGAY